MALGKRAKQRREQLSITQDTVAQYIGVSQVAINNMETRDSQTNRQVIKLAEILDCRVEWLTDGQQPMQDGNSERGLPNGKYEFVRRFDVRAAAGNGYENGDYDEVEGFAFRQSWLREQGLDVEELAVVEVSGSSMLPRLHDGDLILIKTSCTTVQNNRVYALLYGGELRVKRLKTRYDGALVIRSDNPSTEYSDDIIPAEHIEQIQIVGRVIQLVSGGGF